MQPYVSECFFCILLVIGAKGVELPMVGGVQFNNTSLLLQEVSCILFAVILLTSWKLNDKLYSVRILTLCIQRNFQSHLELKFFFYRKSLYQNQLFFFGKVALNTSFVVYFQDRNWSNGKQKPKHDHMILYKEKLNFTVNYPICANDCVSKIFLYNFIILKGSWMLVKISGIEFLQERKLPFYLIILNILRKLKLPINFNFNRS